MTKIDLAWAAGLFDGEGSIFVSSHRGRPDCVTLSLAIQMTEVDPIERFASIFGLKHRFAGLTKTEKEIWTVTTSTESKVKEIFKALYPYLSEHKRIQGDKAIKARDDYTSQSSWHNKEICKHGHKMTEENTYIDKRGYNTCRACRNKNQKQYSLRKKGGVA
jgi:hypothetical protein